MLVSLPMTCQRVLYSAKVSTVLQQQEIELVSLLCAAAQLLPTNPQVIELHHTTTSRGPHLTTACRDASWEKEASLQLPQPDLKHANVSRHHQNRKPRQLFPQCHPYGDVKRISVLAGGLACSLGVRHNRVALRGMMMVVGIAHSREEKGDIDQL